LWWRLDEVVVVVPLELEDFDSPPPQPARATAATAVAISILFIRRFLSCSGLRWRSLPSVGAHPAGTPAIVVAREAPHAHRPVLVGS